MGVCGATSPDTQERKKTPPPRKVIVKSRGKSKVPSYMTVLDLKEHFKKLSKNLNFGESTKQSSSPKRKFSVPKHEEISSPAKKTKFIETSQFWKNFKARSNSKSDVVERESSHSD